MRCSFLSTPVEYLRRHRVSLIGPMALTGKLACESGTLIQEGGAERIPHLRPEPSFQALTGLSQTCNRDIQGLFFAAVLHSKPEYYNALAMRQQIDHPTADPFDVIPLDHGRGSRSTRVSP